MGFEQHAASRQPRASTVSADPPGSDGAALCRRSSTADTARRRSRNRTFDIWRSIGCQRESPLRTKLDRDLPPGCLMLQVQSRNRKRTICCMTVIVSPLITVIKLTPQLSTSAGLTLPRDPGLGVDLLSGRRIKDEHRTTSPLHGGVQGAGGRAPVEIWRHASQRRAGTGHSLGTATPLSA